MVKRFTQTNGRVLLINPNDISDVTEQISYCEINTSFSSYEVVESINEIEMILLQDVFIKFNSEN